MSGNPAFLRVLASSWATGLPAKARARPRAQSEAGQGKAKRTVKALALRVGLSMTLFILLIAGCCFGIILGKIGERQAQSSAARASSVLVAGHAMPINMTSGMMVQMISTVTFSWKCSAL